ncbi:hypothetical protein [Isoptericola variabilis]|uniref:Asparagine synthase n=1 Tax=Isoptericola variabilis (strain 225) TaxID=743718 RepID=F6FT92_ISOV2|nr:hypothetical protein [Isoptericola variabilis]AEG45256.1 hypothetical protein Isova_2550 [Isoptericola variabilis 225]TWH30957.1 uncharacterized protein L600_002800000220 [Isoptericola variabilis J7]
MTPRKASTAAPSLEPATAGELATALAATLARSPADGRIGVLFSGDASSSLLLSLAVRIVGQARVVALVVTSSRPHDVASVADRIGAPTFDMTGRAIEDALRALDLSAVVLGDHEARGDDVHAAGVPALLRPLADVGLGPGAAQRLARDLDLPFIDEAADRTYGEAQEADMHTEAHPTTEEVVQVEAAESELRRLGLADLRVRHHGELARLEAPNAQLTTMTSEPLRGEILRAVRSAGFRIVALDLGAVPETFDA